LLFCGPAFAETKDQAGVHQTGIHQEPLPDKELLLFMLEFSDVDDDTFTMIKERGVIDASSDELPTEGGAKETQEVLSDELN